MLHIAYFQSLAFAAAVFCQVQKSSFHVVAFSRNPSFTESSRLAFVAAPGTHTTSSKTIFDRTHRHTGSITPPFRISPIDAVSGEDTGGGVSLSPILSNHGDDGRDLGLSVARHLDAEWMDQEVHDKIGDAVTDLYTEARCNGVGDVMGVMIFVSEGLEKRYVMCVMYFLAKLTICLRT
mmetsp:Transcript_13644/g.30102  ORF Transcript_13644/g.30102 Transcript_13644/m.30102 type:complete len:179 (-) Transcript_13644:745-1281(-)